MPVLLAALALMPDAAAVCPSEIAIEARLSCSSNLPSQVDHTATSRLGGLCEDEACYACGAPFDEQEQVAPEAVYSFTCQTSGSVTMEITDLPCDLDIYVLDDTCDPWGGCLQGSTASFAADDAVTFVCEEGRTYYIVVEAYGTNHLDIASGPCTDDGTATGTVFSPTYTLSFDVTASTGCNEDCDDGLDNDFDNALDCADDDCHQDPVCCDLDGDGFFGTQLTCGGDDCDDDNNAIHPGAAELVDGLDNDCDDLADEGTDAYDDDGDGFSEREGDCNDADASVNPDATEIPNDGIDQNCDGIDEIVDLDEGEDVDTGADGVGSRKLPTAGCACDSRGGMGLTALLLVPVLLRRRR